MAGDASPVTAVPQLLANDFRQPPSVSAPSAARVRNAIAPVPTFARLVA